MTPVQVLLSLLFAVSIAVGQVLFKLAAVSIGRSSGNFLVRVALNPSAWIAFSWYGASSFLWLFILMRVPLSRAYPFALLGSAIVPLLSWAVFGERPSLAYWLGGTIVLVGLFIALGRPSMGGGAAG